MSHDVSEATEILVDRLGSSTMTRSEMERYALKRGWSVEYHSATRGNGSVVYALKRGTVETFPLYQYGDEEPYVTTEDVADIFGVDC